MHETKGTSSTFPEVFIQPNSIVLSATADDADGSVLQVDFLNGPNLLGRAINGIDKTYSLTWSNVAPGEYSLNARAIDDWGATNYSSPINIEVQPLTLMVESSSDGQFSLTFRGEDDHSYAIETSTDLSHWVPALTSMPTNGWLQFTDQVATNAQRFYRARQ